MTAENIALRQQLITMCHTQKRSPKLKISDRIIFGILTTMINPKRLSRIAIAIKPATILKFHKALVERKYSLLFSNKSRHKPGPKGPSHELIDLILDMKNRNPRFGYRRIAMQITNAFGIAVDKDTVRRVLAKHYNHRTGGDGPSWLTFIGHSKDSLWSIDFLRTESIFLKTHWVMIMMDQFTRRLIGFAVHAGNLDGIAVCCMFNSIISQQTLPKYLSSDNDPLFNFHRWRANLRVLEIEEIKSVPHLPVSHPFIERLIGTVRRELLDRILFWNKGDLKNKLNAFQDYYNGNRCHWSLVAKTPQQKADASQASMIKFGDYSWKTYCRGLFELPVAA